MPSSLELAARLSGVVAAQQEILDAIADVDPLLQVVANRTATIVDASGAVVELREGEELVIRAAFGVAAQQAGLRRPLAGSLAGEAIQQRVARRCDDTESDPPPDVALCRAIGVRSLISAPLLHASEEPLGVLTAFSSRPDGFDDLDVYAMQLLAGMASGAIMRAREFEARRISEERYRMLFERNVAGVFRTTPDGRMLDCNDALVRFLGYDTREELLSHPVWDLYANRSDREQLLVDLKKFGWKLNVRLAQRRKDGSTRDCILNLTVIPGAEGDQILGTLVAAPD